MVSSTNDPARHAAGGGTSLKLGLQSDTGVSPVSGGAPPTGETPVPLWNPARQTDGSYFPDDEPRLAALLDGFLASLSEDLARHPFSSEVCILLLAGGYGRGEGGVFQANEPAEPQLYNDLEFYLILRDGASAGPADQWCAAQAHRGDELLGIEVEFKILREGEFRAAEPSMFYYDLLAAHRVVFGPADFASTIRAELRDPALIPLHEATRLLFNRGTGLFFSSVALHRNDARVANGFIERNHAKVKLALADAVLACAGRYHFSCRERDRRMREKQPGMSVPPDWETLAAWHAEGVEFKLHPRHRHPSISEMQATHDELRRVWIRTFLWLETLRLGTPFHSAADYAGYAGRLYPRTNALRNCALHWRDRLKRGAALPTLFDYPRAPLQRALVLLLQAEPDFDGACKALGLTPPCSLDALAEAYERWWRYYN